MNRMNADEEHDYPIRCQLDCPPRWSTSEIDGSVMVDETLPVGQVADITIGDWREYDLVAAR